MLKLKDGFEKRYFVRCGRCGVRVGYFLDGGNFEEEGGSLSRGGRGDVVLLLQGGLMGTEEVRELGRGQREGLGAAG